VPGAKSCSQSQTQDGHVTHGPCHLVTVVALIVAVQIELQVDADGIQGAPPGCLPPALAMTLVQLRDVAVFE